MGRSEAVARLPMILERFKRAMNLKVCPHVETNSFSFRMPGFKYDDFDRGDLSMKIDEYFTYCLHMLSDGHLGREEGPGTLEVQKEAFGKSSRFVNLVKINRMMETDRTSHFKRLYEKNIDNLRFFMFGTHLQASKTLYRTAALDFPMKYHMQLTGIGKSSIDATQLFIKEETNTILAQRIFRIVNIDSSTRAAAPIPEEIRINLQEKLSKTPDYLRLPRFDVPTSIPERRFVHEVVVRHADLDFFFHANQGSYLLYAFECATRAAAEGFYSRIHEDICYYPAKSASAIHVAEAFAGDVLQIVTWEDISNPMSVSFAIRCKDKDIYYAKVEFYDEQDFNGNGAWSEKESK